MDVSKIFAKPKEDPESTPSEPVVSGMTALPKGITYEKFEELKEQFPERNLSDLINVTIPYTLRHPLSERFHQILKEVGELHDKKQKDYGTKDDPFANVRGATEFGLPASMGAFIAMSDIMQRIKSFCANGRLENEPLDNALRDMAVYSIIALVLWEEENIEKNDEKM